VRARVTGGACATLAALALVVTACGGGDSSPAAGTSGGETATVDGNTVAMTEFAYTPMTATVKVGETLTFVNDGDIVHTVADVDARGEVVSKQIQPRPIDPGSSQAVTFDKPGRVDYICTFHPTSMKGSIEVVR
jgi:plastocyanin